MLRDSSSFLPNPGIIEKLEAIKPGSGDSILSLMESLAEKQRADEKRRLDSMTFKEKCKNLCNTFFTGMAATPLPLGISSTSPEAIDAYMRSPSEEGWVRTGNFIRQAIVQYMQDNNITNESLGLTPQEIDSLQIIPVRGARGPNSLKP